MRKRERNVYFDKRAKGGRPWSVKMVVAGKQKYHGCFATEAEAIAHAEAVRESVGVRNPGPPSFIDGVPVVLAAIDWAKVRKADLGVAKRAVKYLKQLVDQSS